MEEKIRHLLTSVVHPETGQDIVGSGFIEHIASGAGKITVVLRFAKARDPFAVKIKNQAEEILRREFPQQNVMVVIKEGGAAPRPEPKLKTTTGGIAKVIAVASGKGGVGKSTVTANLAVALRNMGYRVGILDADIYGPSQPKMFGVEGYLPDAVQEEGTDRIVPAESMDIRLMSIGFFIKPTDALLWRGAMAVSALKQMINQTKWGTLNFLLADLPPGTGDVAISIAQLLPNSEILVVTTPQVAAAEVAERAGSIAAQTNQKVIGVVENMSFLPQPDGSRLEIFGAGGGESVSQRLTAQLGYSVPLLAQVPLDIALREGGDRGEPVAVASGPAAEELTALAKQLSSANRGLAGRPLGVSPIQH